LPRMPSMKDLAYFAFALVSIFLLASVASPRAQGAQQSPTAAAASGNGQLTAMYVCFSNPPPNPSDLNHKTQYLTAAFEVPVDTQGEIPVIEPAFSAYLKTAKSYPSAAITCQPIWSISDAQAVQKKIASGRDSAKLTIVDTGWRYGQPPLAPGQSGFDPLAQGPGGLDLSQHRLTTYFCSLTAPGGTTMAQTDPALANEVTYITPIFQADWDSATVSMAFDFYMRDHFVRDLNLSDLSPRCNAQSPALQASMYQTAMISNKRTGHSVTVDWSYTPAQAAEARTAESADAAKTAAAQAPTAPANQVYVWCNSSWAGTAGTMMPAGTVMYFSDVFAAVPPQPLGPGSGHGNGGAQRAAMAAFQTPYLAFLQKKYGYKDGGADCRPLYPPTVAGLQAAQKAKQDFEDLAKQNRGQVVETGWKNQ
jgi:hypothetical protein